MSASGEGVVERRDAIPGLPAPTGPFVWTAAWGDLLFVSGLRGIDPATGALAPTDEERAELIFAHLARALEAGGSSLRHVLSTRVYVTEMARHRPIVNAAYERAFGDALPTRTIVEVRALNQGDTIEVEAVAGRIRPSE
ncbi:MAG TPA: RidA family protein [Candidatus Limnocylindria bacterium]|jgi:2-iminobutanoate/2-iminopropanoate deaminase|nr:RidA family protein [Candidatus Limnocylindria bacterium]